LSQFAPVKEFVSELAERGHARQCEAWDVIALRSDPVDFVCFVRFGHVEAVHSHTARLPIYRTYGPGDIVGVHVLVGQHDWPCSFLAKERVSLWMIAVQDFVDMLTRHNLLKRAEAFAQSDWDHFHHVMQDTTARLLQHALGSLTDSSGLKSSLKSAIVDAATKMGHAVERLDGALATSPQAQAPSASVAMLSTGCARADQPSVSAMMDEDADRGFFSSLFKSRKIDSDAEALFSSIATAQPSAPNDRE